MDGVFRHHRIDLMCENSRCLSGYSSPRPYSGRWWPSWVFELPNNMSRGSNPFLKKELTKCALSRNSKGYIALLQDIEADNPVGDIFIITDNLSSHNSLETRTWLEAHPHLHQVFIPTGACWLNLQEGWWRLFRRDALAGQSFVDPKEIEQATRVATPQLNLRTKPWVWGRPAKTPRHRRRLFSYRL